MILSLLVACGGEAPPCPEGCGAIVVEADRYPALQPASAFDVRGDRLLVPQVDGLSVHDLSGEEAPALARWVHSEPLFPVEVRFVTDQELALRSTDGVWWVGGVFMPQLLGHVALTSGLTDQLLSSSTVAAVVHSDGSYTVIDRADPRAPVVAATVPAASPADEVVGACLDGSTLVLLVRAETDDVELVVVDLAEPADPVVEQAFSVADRTPHSLSCDAERVVTTSASELRSFRRLPDGTLEQVLAATPPPQAIWARVDGGRALVQLRPSGARGSMHVLDLAALEGGATWEDALGKGCCGEPNAYAFFGSEPGVLWATGGLNAAGMGTQRYDWTTDRIEETEGPVAPMEPIDNPGGIVRVFGDLAVTEVGAFDVSCPTNPVAVDVAGWGGLEHGHEVASGVLVERSGGVDLVLPTDPSEPEVLDTLPGASAVSAWGERFVGLLDYKEVQLGSVAGGLSATDLGCVPAEGDPVLGPHEACLYLLDAAVTERHIVLLVSGGPVQVYSLDADPPAWIGSVEVGGDGLESDGEWVVVHASQEATPIDLAAVSARAPVPLSDSAPVRVRQGVLYVGGDPLGRWDLATGEALPAIDLPTTPGDFDVAGDRVWTTGWGVALASVDPTCSRQE